MSGEVQNISVTIQSSPQTVYAYASNPEHLANWAAGLSHTKLIQDGEFWIANSPMGKVKIKFTSQNEYGVLDHDVTLPDGQISHNPMRVVKNGKVSEIIFTLFRSAKMSDEAFEADQKAVKKDLENLKSLIESQS